MNLFQFTCHELFRTPSSVSYQLLEAIPQEERPVYFGKTTNMNNIVGRAEMHWNANTHIKIYIRIQLSAEKTQTISRELLKATVVTFIEEHNLPKHSTYEAELIPLTRTLVASNRVDENGCVDGLG